MLLTAPLRNTLDPSFLPRIAFRSYTVNPKPCRLTWLFSTTTTLHLRNTKVPCLLSYFLLVTVPNKSYPHEDFLKFIFTLQDTKYDASFIIYASCLLDQVWKSRNKKIFDALPLNLLEVNRAVNDCVAEFVATREQPRAVSLPCPTWLPPPEGWIKINMDVCVRSSGSITAALVRDHTGKIISASANRVNFTDAQVVEAASLLDGIRLALDQNYNYVVLEGDCSQVYQGFLGDMENIGWDVRSLLLDFQHFLQSMTHGRSQLSLARLILVPIILRNGATTTML
ncbi:hypothetical protein TorRG33x02_194380 [Trema orientale]|uniref:RNase H type-1 domain-containing protein n=1 Tax=Trema orientale TaxID=63057 RepID=A0A2P5EGW0_TREOI|nr:hypothetical protein TorRG33x02_194380 [Trema orientale]